MTSTPSTASVAAAAATVCSDALHLILAHLTTAEWRRAQPWRTCAAWYRIERSAPSRDLTWMLKADWSVEQRVTQYAASPLAQRHLTGVEVHVSELHCTPAALARVCASLSNLRRVRLRVDHAHNLDLTPLLRHAATLHTFERLFFGRNTNVVRDFTPAQYVVIRQLTELRILRAGRLDAPAMAWPLAGLEQLFGPAPTIVPTNRTIDSAICVVVASQTPNALPCPLAKLSELTFTDCQQIDFPPTQRLHILTARHFEMMAAGAPYLTRLHCTDVELAGVHLLAQFPLLTDLTFTIDVGLIDWLHFPRWDERDGLALYLRPNTFQHIRTLSLSFIQCLTREDAREFGAALASVTDLTLTACVFGFTAATHEEARGILAAFIGEMPQLRRLELIDTDPTDRASLIALLGANTSGSLRELIVRLLEMDLPFSCFSRAPSTALDGPLACRYACGKLLDASLRLRSYAATALIRTTGAGGALAKRLRACHLRCALWCRSTRPIRVRCRMQISSV